MEYVGHSRTEASRKITATSIIREGTSSLSPFQFRPFFDPSADLVLYSFEQEIVDILQVLKKEAKITESLLRVRQIGRVISLSHAAIFNPPRSTLSPSQESKAGLAVGKLRSHAAKDVSELAKEIVRTWKTAVDKEKQAAKTPSKGAAKPAAGAHRFLSCLHRI